MSGFKSAIYEGRVFHQRLQPKKHRLNYQICSFLFDLDELSDLEKSIPSFSHNRFNIFSFWNKDHGAGNGEDLRDYVRNILTDAEIKTGQGRIELLCYPRLFGFVFNPLSVYFCYDEDDALKAIIYEVSNTFKQRHSYVISVSDPQASGIRQSCEKSFYVSPFIQMDATYHFNIHPPKDRVAILINQTNDQGPLLKACFSGKRKVLSQAGCLRVLWRYPLMTLKVVAGIYWEALKLWAKGIKLVERPPAPEKAVSFIDQLPLNKKEAKS